MMSVLISTLARASVAEEMLLPDEGVECLGKAPHCLPPIAFY